MDQPHGVAIPPGDLQMRARALPIYVIIVSALMLGPLVVVIGSSFSDSELTRFPPEGLSLRWFRTVLKRSDWIDAFTTSVRIAVITALSALALGVSAALGLVRGRMRWRGAVNAIFLGPVLFPTIVIGIALLQWLMLLGVTRSIWSIVLGHIVITMPFIIRFVMINLQSSGVLLEQAARSLGANGWTAFWRVTLPNMRSALVGGATLAFIISMIDVSVAIFVASVRVRTLPIKLFAHIDQNSDPLGAAVATIVLAITVLAMLVLQRTLGLRRVFAPQRSGRNK